MGYRKRGVNKDEFFEINTKNCSREVLAKKVYCLIHTAYLTPGTKVKPMLGKLWQDEFGMFMSDETFEYMRTNDPVLIIDIITQETREGNEIASNKYLGKAIVSLEFDLWAIENYRAGKKLDYNIFESYIQEKYGRSMENNLSSFRRFNLHCIENYEEIAKALESRYDEIAAFFELVSKNNKMRISIDNLEVKRVDDNRKPQVSMETKAETKSGTTESTKERLRQPVEKKQQEVVVQSQNFEYEIIIKDMQERIDKLERDIKEFKRQRDDAREYSVNQYDKGIKDLFTQMNDIRYGKVIDYLYALLKSDDIDENLASYLDNFFMILEDMEIEPIAGEGVAVVTESNLTKDYNLDFDKKEYVEGGTEIKYVGWKYKDRPMEKPTLKLKEK